MLACFGVFLNVPVALRKESVDRNAETMLYGSYKAVALRKESVDRNLLVPERHLDGIWSLSARRAWIEMPDSTHRQGLFPRRSPQGERG